MRNEYQEINWPDNSLTQKMRVPVKTVIQNVADQKESGEDKSGFLAKSMELPIARFYREITAYEKSCGQ